MPGRQRLFGRGSVAAGAFRTIGLRATSHCARSTHHPGSCACGDDAFGAGDRYFGIIERGTGSAWRSWLGYPCSTGSRAGSSQRAEEYKWPKPRCRRKKNSVRLDAPASENTTAVRPTDAQKLNSDTRTPTPEAEGIAQRWLSFGDFIRTKSKPLFSMFPEIEFCGVRKKDDRTSTVFLSVPEKFQRDMLMNMKDEMQIALREFFGTPLLFETGTKSAMQAKAGIPVVANPEMVAELTPQPLRAEDRSELEVVLMERLGAQPV